MKIPKKLRIDGENWIVLKNKNLIRNESARGMITYDKKLIQLDSNSTRTATSLLHECIHAIDNNAALDLSEEQVKRLAHGLYAIIRDNKLNFNE